VQWSKELTSNISSNYIVGISALSFSRLGQIIAVGAIGSSTLPVIGVFNSTNGSLKKSWMFTIGSNTF
jgi:hypothetical protein